MIFVSYLYPRFDCKVNVSLCDLHGSLFVSSVLYKSAFMGLWLTDKASTLRCHVTQDTRRGHSCPLDTYLVMFSSALLQLQPRETAFGRFLFYVYMSHYKKE